MLPKPCLILNAAAQGTVQLGLGRNDHHGVRDETALEDIQLRARGGASAPRSPGTPIASSVAVSVAKFAGLCAR